MRRYGEAVIPAQKYRNRIGVYAIIERQGHFLLTEQSAPMPEIQLPGGGVDPGESPLQALHREVREETGWRIADPLRLGAYQRYTYMPEYDLWARKMCVIYVAHAVRKLSDPTEPGHRVIWADADSASELLAISGDQAFMADWIRGAYG
ncbi:MAG: NUDIX hydrolase [Pseudomonadota bacterium]